MAFFPRAADTTFAFVTPRDPQRSESGVYYTRHLGGNFWKGSITFAPQADQADILQHLQALDSPGSFFFADIRTPGVVASTITPRWHVAGTPFATHITMDPTSQTAAPKKGDVISLRAQAAPDYPTARVISDVVTISPQVTEIRFNVPIPTEFLITAFGSVLEFCLNRPHVRAVIDGDSGATRWRMGTQPVATIPTFAWREDTGAIVGRLTTLQDIADTTEPILLETISGNAIQFSDGSFWEVNP